MATDDVYQFLRVHQRPFTLMDIVSSLPDTIGIGGVQRALVELMDQGKVFRKSYGKKKLYCIVPDKSKAPYELMEIEQRLKNRVTELKSILNSAYKDIRKVHSTILTLRSIPPLLETRRDYQQRRKKIQDMEERLVLLKQLNESPDLSEKQKEVKKLLDLYSQEYNTRKRLCTDILDCVAERHSLTKESLYEEIGIDEKIVSKKLE